MTLATFLPQDRLQTLARGESLPDRTSGSALFADISGFTHLTEALREALGPRRGAEELTRQLDAVYTALIEQVERYGGSVIDFAGDSILCWFDDAHGPAPPRAVGCAFGLQEEMLAFAAIPVPQGPVISLALKVAVATGPARRFVVGDPLIRYMDTLAGATVARTSMAEHLAGKGEILLDEATVQGVQGALTIAEWRQDQESQHRFAAALEFSAQVSAFRAFVPPGGLAADRLRDWVHPKIYEREQAWQETFLTEFRPCVAMFVRFQGLDYDSEEAAEQLDILVRHLQACAERHGGILLQLTIGDKGSYAYISFGAFTTYEDEARRAVKTALDLKETASHLHFVLPLQIGITHGVMRVGACGSRTRRTYSALGDETNLAARLMTSCAPGEILISGRLRKTLADEFEVEARPPMAMKGTKDLLPVFAVWDVKHQRAIRLQEPAYTSLMIGRKQEMRLLDEAIQSVLHGQGRIIGITAEAGMGKSRLVAEGIRLARRRNLVGYGGACQSDAVSTPYLVWRSIWNAFFDLDPSVPLRKQIRALEGQMEDLAPEHMDALPLLGTILGLPLPDNDFTRALQPRDRKTQLETIVVRCIESAAREAAGERGGLLFVLEDLHWIDPVSLDLLEIIGRSIENLPVLVLMTYRLLESDLQQGMGNRLAALDHFTQIRLSDLNDEETEQVIRSKLFSLFPERGDRVSPALVDRIINRAQGNPFYAEELLNYLHDRGIDLGDTSAFHQLELPASLHSLILSRIDQLTTSQQITIKVASVIGRIFRFEDLHNYYPSLGTAERLKADLRELDRLELTPLETPEPELTYLFKHLVTHEVGYESLSFATRAQLHGQYARYLESAYPDRTDQLSPHLAHHFERAQIDDKARYYLNKAGERAASIFANDEALFYFNRALDLTPAANTRGRFELLLLREGVFDLLGRHAEQRLDLEELSQLANQLEDAPLLRAKVAARQAKMEIDVGNYPAAISSAQAAIQEMEADTTPRPHAADLLVDALWLQARAMFFAGQGLVATPQLERALSLAREHQYLRGQYNALAQLGLNNWNSGDYATAAALMEQSLSLIRQAGDVRRELEILNNLGIVAKAKANFAEAVSYYERAQKMARKIGDRSGEATLLTNMGSASLIAGDYVMAGSYSEQAAAMASEVNEPTLQGIALTNQGEAYRELGQYRLANLISTQALALVRSCGYRRGEAIVLDNLGLIEIALGDHARAEEWIQAALKMARETGSRATEGYALLHLGMLYTETRRFDAAERALSSAQDIIQELGDELMLFELQARLANFLLGRGSSEDVDQAHAHLSQVIAALLGETPQVPPLWLYLTCIRVLQARYDPRAAPLINLAITELRARSTRISDPAVRQGYLNISEHAVILNLGGAASASDI